MITTRKMTYRSVTDCLNDSDSRFSNYEDRLITFANWPNISVNPEDLASAGFYYVQQPDIVKCAFCHCEFYDWYEGDDPLHDHYKFAKYCELAKVLWKCRQVKYKALKSVKPKRRQSQQPKSSAIQVSPFFLIPILILLGCGIIQIYNIIKDFEQDV